MDNTTQYRHNYHNKRQCLIECIKIIIANLKPGESAKIQAIKALRQAARFDMGIILIVHADLEQRAFGVLGLRDSKQWVETFIFNE